MLDKKHTGIIYIPEYVNLDFRPGNSDGSLPKHRYPVEGFIVTKAKQIYVCL